MTQVPDQHHPRGYRELCNSQELTRRKHLKIFEQGGFCAQPAMGGCGKKLQDYFDAELDHIEPKGMGGAFKDDHIDNLQILCHACNTEKGSKRIYGVA